MKLKLLIEINCNSFNRKSIGIVQRLMCYQKKYRIRLDYNWQNLWTSLISTLKFVLSYESTLMSKGYNLFTLYSRVNSFKFF
jgi:hypothetical protein